MSLWFFLHSDSSLSKDIKGARLQATGVLILFYGVNVGQRVKENLHQGRSETKQNQVKQQNRSGFSLKWTTKAAGWSHVMKSEVFTVCRSKLFDNVLSNNCFLITAVVLCCLWFIPVIAALLVHLSFYYLTISQRVTSRESSLFLIHACCWLL